MYIMSSKLDSRELIQDKFLKKTRTFIVNSTPDIDYIEEPIIYLDDDQSEHSINETFYDYLVDDPLSKEYNEDELQNNNVFVCMYKKNTELVLPYITYYLIENNNTMQFFKLNITEPVQDEDGNADTDGDDNFIEPTYIDEDLQEEKQDNMKSVENIDNNEKKGNSTISGGGDDVLFNRCSQYIQNISEEGSNITYDCYKGFIQSEGDIYCFVDITDIYTKDENLYDFTTCIIDEIIRSKQVNGKNINSKITNIFKNESLLRYMVNQNDVLINNPIIVYLCENNNDQIINSVYETDDSQTISIIGNDTEHPVVGDGHLFSTKIIDESIASRVKRFVLFHYDAVFVLHEPLEASEYDLISDVGCVSFLADGKEFWSTKNINIFNEI